MRDARTAGIRPDISATPSRTATMLANVAGSVGSTPKSSDETIRAPAREVAVPMAAAAVLRVEKVTMLVVAADASVVAAAVAEEVAVGGVVVADVATAAAPHPVEED